MVRGSSENVVIAPPRKASPLLLGSLLPVAFWLVVRALITPAVALPALYSSLGFSLFGAVAVAYVTPLLGPSFVNAGLKGRDLLKKSDEVMQAYSAHVP